MVRASADAIVTAKPDRAQISVGVQTQAATAQEAANQNATQTSQVLETMKQALGQGGEVRTIGYSVSPQYQFPKEGGPGKIMGYLANNTVEATIDDLSRVGKLIDTVTGSGANNIQGISFTLKDDSEVRSQALVKAAVKARASAEAMAKALNVRVIGVLQAEASEGAAPIRPMMMQSRAVGASAVSTPVEAGNIEIRATVVVTLQVQ